MKKTILVAAVLAATVCSAVAQQSYRYVTPIMVECMQFNVQQLRDSSSSETEYIAELNSLLNSLSSEKSEIDNITKGLKLEKDLYNAMMSSYKTRKSQLEKAQKAATSEIKTYEGLLRDLQKQKNIMRKMNVTDGTAVKDNASRIEKKDERYRSEMQLIQQFYEKLKKNSDEEINTTFTMLNDYLIELTDKETRLKNISAQNKTNIEIVKSALKAAKAK